MAFSLREVIYWLQDISSHLAVSQRRKTLRRPGEGFDYTQDKDTVRRIVDRLHPERMRLQVTEIIRETPSTKTLRLAREDGDLPPFRPGQYVNVHVEVDGVRTSRPYSIACAPGQGYLDLTIRDNPGGFVAPYMLNELQVGDQLETSGPAGNFYYEPLIDGHELVFLAGGSGITPFMSILRACLGADGGSAPVHIHLLYGCRSADDVIYGQELTELAARYPNFDYSLVISEPSPDYEGLVGFLEAGLIRQEIGDVQGKTFYLCGPPAMYQFCFTALRDLEIPRHKIKRELFGPPDVTLEPGWPLGLSPQTVFSVEVVGERTVRAPAGEPLLNTLERHGLVVPAVCRVGECSECRVRLLAGQVFMPQDVGLRESDRQFGYIHACVSYPLEDLQIRI